MNDNELVEKNVIDLRSKVMLKKIDKLHETFQILKNFPNEVKTLLAIKEQYLKMYNEMLEREAYEKYPDIENVVVDALAKLEIRIETYLYNTISNFEKIVLSRIEDIRKSESYQNFKDIDSNLKDIEKINKLMNLYNNYVSKNKMEKVKIKLSEVKFEVLYRKQVEELIYEFGESKSNLSLYENEQEKEIFEKSLQNIITTIKSSSEDERIRSDKLFDISIEQILNDSNLAERLIILDMKTHPIDYINLVKAKLFNAHLCNIGNNPFESEIYLTKEQLHRLGYYKYGDSIWYGEEKFDGLRANKVNYSLLKAILENIITDENINIIECRNLYKRFGFECRPILISIGQQCVNMILNQAGKSDELESIEKEFEKDKQKEDRKYCKINFEGLVYEFYEEEQDSDDLLEQILDEREVLIEQNPRNKERKKFFISKETQEMPEPRDLLQEKKDKVKGKGVITTDLDIIILLIKDIINKYNDEIQELNIELEKKIKEESLEELEYSFEKLEIENYEKKIKKRNRHMEWLKSLKNKKLTLEETRQLLLIINDVYSELNIKYDVRKLIPLEDMGTQNSHQVYLAPIPEERGSHFEEVSHDFLYGSKFREESYYRSDLKPLWKKYQKGFEDLGIDVKKYSRYYESKPCFDICINLNDISDLPIDYDKVQLLTKEELQEIVNREKENER